MASKRPPRGPQDGSKIDQKSIKNRWFYEVEKAGFWDPSHTLGNFFKRSKTCFFWTSIFHQFFICFAIVFIFVLLKSSSWGKFSVIFFLQLKAAPDLSKCFFLGLQGAAWGPKVREGCRFFAFVRVVVDIVFGPLKPPKIGPLKLFQVYKFRFYSLP